MNYSEIVLASYKKVIEDNNLDIEPSLDAVIGRDSGLDSLGMVTLMIEIEELLDITLENELVNIRNSKTLSEIVPFIEKAHREVGV